MALANKDWEVRIVLNEREGDSTTTQPWYKPEDIVAIIRSALHRDGPMRDLTVQAVNASTDGKEYYR